MKNLINTRLEIVRKEHKLTRKGLEEISGFKERTIGSYERGENTPSKEYIEFMCLFFGYIENYFKNDKFGKLDKIINIILMYQSIFNYDNKKMSELLNISLDKYINNFNLNIREKNHISSYGDDSYINFTPNERFTIAENLGIKPSLLYGKLEDERKSIIKDLEKVEYQKILKNEPKKTHHEIMSELMFNDNFTKAKNEALKELIERENKAEKNGINLTHEYYAEIIKQRNNPDIVTPNTQKETIPDKYKDIIELLPYASDSFIENLKKKLISLKEAQQLEDL